MQIAVQTRQKNTQSVVLMSVLSAFVPKPSAVQMNILFVCLGIRCTSTHYPGAMAACTGMKGGQQKGHENVQVHCQINGRESSFAYGKTSNINWVRLKPQATVPSAPPRRLFFVFVLSAWYICIYRRRIVLDATKRIRSHTCSLAVRCLESSSVRISNEEKINVHLLGFRNYRSESTQLEPYKKACNFYHT